MYSLVIVDVQPGMRGLGMHPENKEKLFPEINKLVEDAVNKNAHIVLVEWFGSGSTYPDVTSPLLNYTKWTTVYKERFSGGEEVVKKIKQYKLPRKHIKVCGVYREVCVKETARTLGELLPKSKVEIVEAACLSQKVIPSI